MQTLVYFSISNAANIPLTGSTTQYNVPNYVTLAPQSYPLNNNESILDADVITYVPDSTGTFTASLYPQFYKGYINGVNTHTHFILNVPNTGSAVNAADYLVVLSSSVVNAGKYAYSMADSDARYVLSGSGNSSVSSSYALSASYVPNLYPQTYQISGSWASASLSASYAPQIIQVSASWASSSISSSYALTSSHVEGLVTYPNITDANGIIGLNGYVGINYQPNPQYTLDVNGSIGNSMGDVNLIANGDVGGGSSVYIQTGLPVGGGYDTINGGNIVLSAGSGVFIDQDSAGGSINLLGGSGNPGINGAAVTIGGTSGGEGGNFAVNTGAGAYNGIIELSTGVNSLYIDSTVGGNGGAVGINMSAPQYGLDVNGTIGNSSQNSFHIVGFNSNGYSDGFINFDANGKLTLQSGGTPSAGDQSLDIISQFQMLLTAQGGVGINNSSPEYTLDVDGYTRLGDVGGNDNSTLFIVTNEYFTFNNGSVGIGKSNPTQPLDVVGNINFTGNLLKNGSAYVPNNAVTASYVSASTVIANNYLKMPYSASNHSLTPTVDTGSMYFKISGSVKLLYVYSGTAWSSCSLA